MVSTSASSPAEKHGSFKNACIAPRTDPTYKREASPMTLPTAEETNQALFDADGSTRDITFTPVDKRNIPHLIERLKIDFPLLTATDGEGLDVREVLLSDPASFVSSPERTLSSYWESRTHAISSIQLFAFWPEPNGSASVELSFHPRDLIRERFDLSKFVAEVDAWSEALGASNYFVRYENMSWKIADGITPDVIFTKEWHPLR